MHAQTTEFASGTTQPPEQFGALLQDLDELRRLLEQQPDTTQPRQHLQEICAQVQQNQPTVLLYGNYNAGKSSLINLLLGQDVAPVDDIPTTAQLRQYLWRGIRLWDSPGINAPIAHQQLSQAELEKTDLLLFVIRSGDVDEAALFHEMARMCLDNKPLCLLLNCDSSDPAQVQCWQRRLNENLLKHLIAAGISETRIRAIPLLPVNLLTARRAQEQSQPHLLEASGFPLIESRLLHWARQQWQQAGWLGSLFVRLDRQVIQPVLQGAADNVQLVEMEQRLRELAATEQQWQAMATAQLSAELQALHPRLQQALALPSAEVQDALTAEIAAVTTRLHAWLAERYGALPESTLSAWAQWQNTCAPATDDPRLTEIYQQLQGMLTPERIHELLQQGQKIGLPWLKKLSQSSLGQLANRLNIALRLLSAGWEFYSAGHEEDRAQAQARERALLQHQQLAAIIEHLSSQLQEQLVQLIALLFAPQRQALQAAHASRLAEADKHEQWQQQLQRLRQQLKQRCQPAE